jgi:hypothetical protein
MQLLYQEIEQHWRDQITVRFNSRCVAINKTIELDTPTVPHSLKPWDSWLIETT